MSQSSVAIEWVTPNGEATLARIARVSNVAGQHNPKFVRLLNYLIRNKHWSPFEMVGMCVCIDTVRDVSHQIIRHRSFRFQEFSGRYAENFNLGELLIRPARMQDTKNRQNSLPCDNQSLRAEWLVRCKAVAELAEATFRWGIDQGVAKEVARSVLPEGMAQTRVYMHGTLRDFLHYVQVRCTPETQKEHREVAEQIDTLISIAFPHAHAALHFVEEN